MEEIKITTEKISNWMRQAQLKGISPNTLIIKQPDTPSINICGREVFIHANPLIHKIMGIEIWTDETIPEGKAYLFDKNSIEKIDCSESDLPARFVEDDVIARNDLEKLKKQRTNLKCIREVLDGFTLSIFYSASQYSKALLKIDELLKEAGY